MSRRILVVDDEEAICRSLDGILRDEGYEVAVAASGEEGLEKADTEDPDLVLLDVWLPGLDGLGVLEALRARRSSLPVLMMSGHGTIETALRARRLGAFDFLEKPLNLDKVLLAIENALRTSRLAEEVRFWRGEAARRHALVGGSPALGEMLEQIRAAAVSRAPVLVTGERGTGKELAARAIHAAGKRSECLFVGVNCAGPEDLVESELFGCEKGAVPGAAARSRGKLDPADGGTLFLDEIGDLSPRTQARILRVLQEKRFERVGGSRAHPADVRVIASASGDLESAARDGRFREDLYLRLEAVRVRVPPLRERLEDVPLLLEHFVRLFCGEEKREPVRVAPAVVDLLQAYDWPGNVRELKNVAERMVLLSRDGTIQVDDVPASLRAGVGSGEG